MRLYTPPDDDLIEVETCGRNLNDKLFFVSDCAIFGLHMCVCVCVCYNVQI